MNLKKKIASANYRVKQLFFEKFAMPNVIFDKISKSILKKYLPPNPVILDCGAHDGTDTAQLAKMFSKGIVYAFEPVDALYQKLKKVSLSSSNIKCFQLALADIDGTMDFYVSEGSSDASSSLLQPKDHLTDHPDTFFKNKISVKTNTLDTWAINNHVSKIDLLWLDMQGYELNMLMASPAILQTVTLIHTEVSTKETYKGVAQYIAYRNFLESKGFKVLIEAIPNGWDMGNVLFIKNTTAD